MFARLAVAVCLGVTWLASGAVRAQEAATKEWGVLVRLDLPNEKSKVWSRHPYTKEGKEAADKDAAELKAKPALKGKGMLYKEVVVKAVVDKGDRTIVLDREENDPVSITRRIVGEVVGNPTSKYHLRYFKWDNDARDFIEDIKEPTLLRDTNDDAKVRAVLKKYRAGGRRDGKNLIEGWTVRLEGPDPPPEPAEAEIGQGGGRRSDQGPASFAREAELAGTQRVTIPGTLWRPEDSYYTWQLREDGSVRWLELVESQNNMGTWTQNGEEIVIKYRNGSVVGTFVGKVSPYGERIDGVWRYSDGSGHREIMKRAKGRH